MKRNLLVLLSGLVRPSILLLGLVFLALGPAASQDRPAKPKPDDAASAKPETKDETAEEEDASPFGETIFVRVVNVDVFVRDKDGNPVTGLTQDDFELYEDGKPIAITNFYEYKEGKEVREEEAPAPEKRDRPRSRDEVFESHPGLATSDVPEDQRLNLVVYVDQQNITPINRNKLFRYLRQFLNTKLDRDDRVMLVTYNRSLKVVRPFTTDSQLVADATYELEKHTGGRSTQNSDRIDVLKDIDEGRDCQMSFGRAKLYAENVFNDLQFTLDGLRTAMDQLAGVPGRKAVLYVSEGLQMRAGEDVFWAIDERFRDGGGDSQQGASVGAGDCSNAIMESFHYDASRRLTDIANAASANRVTIYTVDAAGLRIGGLRSAEFGSIGLSTNIESIYTRNLQDTLMFLADKTGGRSIVNTNNFLDGLSSIGADFDNFYSLGFQPSHAGTGRRYPLEVKIKKDVMRAHNIKDSNVRIARQLSRQAPRTGDGRRDAGRPHLRLPEQQPQPEARSRGHDPGREGRLHGSPRDQGSHRQPAALPAGRERDLGSAHAAVGAGDRRPGPHLAGTGAALDARSGDPHPGPRGRETEVHHHGHPDDHAPRRPARCRRPARRDQRQDVVRHRTRPSRRRRLSQGRAAGHEGMARPLPQPR